jgi:hypothetical protein
MQNVLYSLLMDFGRQMGMTQVLLRFIAVLQGATLIIAAGSCFFGLRVFRLGSAVLAFLLTAMGITALMSATAGRGTVVITFTLLGLVAAFVAYQWQGLSVFVLCATLVYGLVAQLTDTAWIALAAGIAVAAAATALSPTLVVWISSLWGAVTLAFDGLALLGATSQTLKMIAAVVLTAAGVVVQYAVNRDAGLLWSRGFRKSR